MAPVACHIVLTAWAQASVNRGWIDALSVRIEVRIARRKDGVRQGRSSIAKAADYDEADTRLSRRDGTAHVLHARVI
jgi:hypothetical protein